MQIYIEGSYLMLFLQNFWWVILLVCYINTFQAVYVPKK